MLTLFSTPKPFNGHSAVIQRNALESWRRLDPDIEIILFGDDEGSDELCRELGIRHEPHVERNRFGTNRVDYLFGRAQQMARHSLLCYSNCDIILMGDFLAALKRVASEYSQFLMIGRRWDTYITKLLDFQSREWANALGVLAKTTGFQRLHYNIDYFAFRRGLYRDIPPLAVGRRWWDQWAVWNAGAHHFPVIDASDAVCAVHQNHDYSSHPEGISGMWHGEEAHENFRLAGGWRRLHTIEDATHRLTAEGIEPKRYYWIAPAKRRIRRMNKTIRTAARTKLWHPFLDRTRALRHALGLRQDTLPELGRRSSERRHWLDQ